LRLKGCGTEDLRYGLDVLLLCVDDVLAVPKAVSKSELECQLTQSGVAVEKFTPRKVLRKTLR
jgi:hypothetical protein